VLWIFVFLIAMSLMGMRKTWYMVPILPAMALVTAAGLDRLLSDAAQRRLAVASVYFVAGAAILIQATPVSLSPGREKDIRLVAPYVRHLVTDSTPFLLVDDAEETWFAVNNPLLFYADRAAETATVETFRQVFAGPGLACALARPEKLAMLRAAHSGLFTVKQGSDLALVANREVDTANVVPLRLTGGP
jgi:hypothetical protein